MQREKLVNQIKGSYLKEYYLDAFLVQSAYIEGLLRLFADFSYWQETKDKTKKSSPLILEIRKKIRKYPLNELIDFLHRGELIDDDQKKELHSYREKRNEVMHDLVGKIAAKEFEQALKNTCELGEKIIEGKKFKEMEDLIDAQEEEIPEESQPNEIGAGGV